MRWAVVEFLDDPPRIEVYFNESEMPVILKPGETVTLAGEHPLTYGSPDQVLWVTRWTLFRSLFRFRRP